MSIKFLLFFIMRPTFMNIKTHTFIIKRKNCAILELKLKYFFYKSFSDFENI
jgi:hypothetical protein